MFRPFHARTHKIVICGLFLGASYLRAMGIQLASSGIVADKRSQFTRAFQDAVASPYDRTVVNKLELLLPKSGEYFVIEGDLLFDERQLQTYLAGQNEVKTSHPSQELIVATKSDGSRDYYKDLPDRKLTYSIDRSSFPTPQQYSAVATYMQAASRDWMQACMECGITITHKPADDSAPSTDKTTFVLRYINANAAYLAASFFPSDPALRRYLNIDPSYFGQSGYDKIGVLRHEIGHILGYRHEQIRGLAGCELEDNQWAPLTPYDPHSVMHYFCGGAGTMSLALTPLDISGHRALYVGKTKETVSHSDRRNDSAGGNVTLVVRAEGGDVAKEAASILLLLQEKHLLPLTEKPIQNGETISGIYARKLNLPGSSSELQALEAALNPDLTDPRRIVANQSITYPDVRFETYSFKTKIDQAKPSDVARYNSLKKNWAYLAPKGSANNSVLTLTHTGYELRVDVSATDAERLTAVINDKQLRNVYATYIDTSIKAPFFSHPDLTSFRDSLMDSSKRFAFEKDEAFVGSAIRVPEDIPATYGCYGGMLTRSQDIILVDQPVHHHPDLEQVVDVMTGTLYDNPVPDSSGLLTLTYRNFSKASDHGTHLAGLIAANHNGFGIAGVNPGEKVVSWDWTRLSPDAISFGAKIRSRVEDGDPPIFVFASQWQKQQQKTLDTYLESDQALWVVAAGEPVDEGVDGQTATASPLDIDNSHDNVPMGLGQRPYVIVVTACDNCFNEHLARISPYANYSTHQYVTVAAPGNLLPSTVGGGGYGAASGTSQAAAVTAGLVSAMVDCWPRYYSNQPSKVKFRLQLTSWPGLHYDDHDKAQNDMNKVASGVVDGRAALLDPTKSWLLTTTLGVVGEKVYESVRPKSWCMRSLNLRRADGQDAGSLDLREVRRIVKIGEVWYAYAHAVPVGSDPQRDAVRRIGPGVLDQGDNNVPLLETEGGRLSLSQLDDLILSDSVGFSACGTSR